MARSINQFLSAIKKGYKSKNVYIKIRATSEEIIIEVHDRTYSRKWMNIERIAVFKRDLVTEDVICLGFFFKSGVEPLEINEDMNGFTQVATMLEKIFPSIRRNWFNDVSNPTFESNYTILYDVPNDSAIGSQSSR